MLYSYYLLFIIKCYITVLRSRLNASSNITTKNTSNNTHYNIIGVFRASNTAKNNNQHHTHNFKKGWWNPAYSIHGLNQIISQIRANITNHIMNVTSREEDGIQHISMHLQVLLPFQQPAFQKFVEYPFEACSCLLISRELLKCRLLK